MRIFLSFSLGLLLFMTGCREPASRQDYYLLPTYSSSGVNMVVEIPAGTNLQWEYDAGRKEFIVDKDNGEKPSIEFLPYPGNYGFIPSTLVRQKTGTDGHPLDVLLLSSTQAMGSVLPVHPIGILELMNEGELDSKIIAVPADSSLQTIRAGNFQDLLLRYDGARRIVETWFLQYKGLGRVELVGWKDEQAAMAEIKKWAK